jgi:hypothetical protein
MAGMGNQMFQLAMIWAHSKKYQINYAVPTKVIAPHIHGKQDAYRFPGINYLSDPPALQEYKEKSFRYELIPPVDNVCFNGYWQSWKYFDEYRNELLDVIGFPYKENKGVVSIHVRRGDFLDFPNHHPVVSEAYLGRAIFFFMQRGFLKFKVFSDDIPWAKENLPQENIQLEFSEGQDEVQDMIDASCCSGNIGSNSTFSWWIHYLNQNKNKIGVFPRRWFGENLNHDISDLLPANTIML